VTCVAPSHLVDKGGFLLFGSNLCDRYALLRDSGTIMNLRIDHKTDNAIQLSLRHKIDRDTTVITVAHRLQTIMDVDKIVSNSVMSPIPPLTLSFKMVLDAGRIVNDTDHGISQTTNIIFRSNTILHLLFSKLKMDICGHSSKNQVKNNVCMRWQRWSVYRDSG
jgi:hypothetical protein